MEMTLRSIATITFLSLIASIALAQGSPDQTPPEQNPPAQNPPSQNPPAQNPPAAPAPTPSPTPAPLAVTKWQVFAGYSLFHAGVGILNGTNFDVDLGIYPKTLVPQTNFGGWNVEVQHNFGRWVGAVADFSGFSGKPFTGLQGVGGVPSETSYSILAGPVISYRAKKNIVPYIHALFGWNHVNLDSGPLTGTPIPASSAGATYTDFAMAFGGGVDYKVTRRVAVRIGQLDWFRTTIDLNSFYGDAFGTGLFAGFAAKERNIRFSTGIVVNF
jgi:opacity protein-like surface antigen